MMKKILFLLGFIFFCLGILLFFFLALPEVDKKSIQQDGTLSVGKPVGAGSSLTVNDVPYYYIRFKYTDNEGNQKLGVTSSAYTEEEMLAIRQSDKIDIKYNDKGAVQADYERGSDFYAPLVISSVFGGIGIILLALFTFFVMKSIKLKTEGCDVLAKFTSCGSNVVINGEKRYYIEMVYMDPKNGEIQLAKTDSIYKQYEIEFFKQLGEFKARCYKNTAMVLEDRNKAKEMLFKQSPPPENQGL